MKTKFRRVLRGLALRERVDQMGWVIYSGPVRKDSPIVVALSGGVDSAVAAGLLKSRGHEVVGMTMRLHNPQGTTKAVGRCCSPKDVEDARRICEHLEIPFYVVDFENEFIDRVVEDFVDGYVSGQTPNPCVRCNQYIKFTPLLKHARAIGAEILATGHYARIEQYKGSWTLRRGVDVSKDQSYFLYSMPTDELPYIQFPLGGMTKEEVRRLAEEMKLPVANKPESQEICFVPDGDYAGFVEKYTKKKGRSLPVIGSFVSVNGEKVGEHRGVHHYTVGQRRGLGDVAGNKRVYVVRIDTDKDEVVVGDRQDVARESVQIKDVRWFVPESKQGELSMQVRYRSSPDKVRVEELDGGIVRATFQEGTQVAAPGQSAVFYEGEYVVGGGWITS